MKPVIPSLHLAAQAYATQARGTQTASPSRVSDGSVSARAPTLPAVTIEISAAALEAARAARPDRGAVRPALETGGVAPRLSVEDSRSGDRAAAADRGIGRREAPRAAQDGLAQDSRPGRLIDIRV